MRGGPLQSPGTGERRRWKHVRSPTVSSTAPALSLTACQSAAEVTTDQAIEEAVGGDVKVDAAVA